MADSLNGARKFVATHRPGKPGLGAGGKASARDIATGIRKVKEAGGPDLTVWGSSTLTPLLIAEGLHGRGGALLPPGADRTGQAHLRTAWTPPN